MQFTVNTYKEWMCLKCPYLSGTVLTSYLDGRLKQSYHIHDEWYWLVLI